MEFDELMQKVEIVSRQYAEEYGIARDSDWCILKVQEEMGELIQAYLMMTKRGRDKGLTPEELRTRFENEFADVMCMLLLFARFNNVKLMHRIKEKWLSRLKD